jgi:homoserine dehydrogenase
MAAANAAAVVTSGRCCGGGHPATARGHGLPIIKALREGLVANRFRRIYGILNGTCNYILTRMEREGASYDDVLAEAKTLGYAEAEESLDVDGWDTAHKAGILAFLAHGKWVGVTEMRVEGIRRINQDDMAFAQAFDFKIKLIAIIERDFITNELVVRVQPMLLPERLVMANVDEVYNGVCVVGDVVGTTLYIGRGAGQDATSSAVISDIVDAVGVLCSQKPPLIPDEVPGILGDGSDLTISPAQNVTGCYYFRLFVRDEPGVLEQVASIMAKQRVSIASVLQRESDAPDVASLILTTHETNEAAIERAVLGLQVADCVLDDPVVLKIADFED